MRKHTKIYMDHFRYNTSDWIPCEICENKAVDIHHIDARGMGGDPNGKKDIIENLMALCRWCHENFGDVPEAKELLYKIHQRRMKSE